MALSSVAQIARGIQSWAIQYRRINVFEVAASPFDLTVIDFDPTCCLAPSGHFRSPTSG